MSNGEMEGTWLQQGSSLTNGKFLLFRILELGPEPLERVVDVHVPGERLAVHSVQAASRLRTDPLQLGGGQVLLKRERLSNMGTSTWLS